MVRAKDDMTGWVMSEHGVSESRLTVIKQVEDHVQPNGVHSSQWLCQCECGSSPFKATGGNIRSGNTLSCGCYRVTQTIKSNKKYNKYDLSGEYGIGWATNSNKEFYFDIEDHELIKNYAWYTAKTKKYIALKTRLPNTNKTVTMAQLLGCKYYDHINRNPLDNRRENLRPATHEENMKNKGLVSSNTSGVTGVVWDKNTKSWRATIAINKVSTHIGRFLDKTDAIKARLIAEKENYGEFAPQQHLFEKYNI